MGWWSHHPFGVPQDGLGFPKILSLVAVRSMHPRNPSFPSPRPLYVTPGLPLLFTSGPLWCDFPKHITHCLSNQVSSLWQNFEDLDYACLITVGSIAAMGKDSGGRRLGLKLSSACDDCVTWDKFLHPSGLSFLICERTIKHYFIGLFKILSNCLWWEF